MTNIKACIFDLDGVIVDTAKYHYKAWKELAAELGFDFTEKDNERLKGVSRMDSLNILLEIGGVEMSNSEKQKYAEQKNKRYREFIFKMTPQEVLPGAVNFLEAVKKAGFKTALGSASKNASVILERTNLNKYFDVVIDGTKTSKAKPDPEVFLLGANALNVFPADCVVFEDAEAGVQAALNAGMFCIGIGDKTILYKAHKVVSGLHEMNIDMLKF
jgi:beta-phosphoglucomutase